MDFLELDFLLRECKGGALEPVNFTFGEFRSLPGRCLCLIDREGELEEEELEDELRE